MLFAKLFREGDMDENTIREMSSEGLRPTEENLEFISKMYRVVVAKLPELQKVVARHAVERPLDQVAFTDQAILFLGAYEILYGNDDDVPPLVAINEAVDVAKQFSSDAGAGFVNGVLNAIYQEKVKSNN